MTRYYPTPPRRVDYGDMTDDAAIAAALLLGAKFVFVRTWNVTAPFMNERWDYGFATKADAARAVLLAAGVFDVEQP